MMFTFTHVIDIAALFCLTVLLYSNTALHVQRRKPFLLAIILTVVIILSEAGTMISSNENLNLRSLHILFNILGFALNPMIPIAITLIFNRMILKTYKFLLIPTMINMIAVVLSPVFKLIFHVDPNNMYTRGDYFFIFVTVYIINLIFLIVITLEFSKKNNYPIVGKIAALSIFTIIGTSIQLIYPLAYSTWHCVTLSLLLYFLLMSEYDSSFDALTGLYNRASFDRAIKQIGETAALSLIVLDIDDFKVVNDTYGHSYWDYTIKTVAEIIRKSFDKDYTCYRLGGDEFYIIGKETEQGNIENSLRNMTSNLTKMREGGILLSTVSYGYSIFPGGEKLDFNKVLKEADDQMYHYKKIHKDNAAKQK